MLGSRWFDAALLHHRVHRWNSHAKGCGNGVSAPTNTTTLGGTSCETSNPRPTQIWITHTFGMEAVVQERNIRPHEASNTGQVDNAVVGGFTNFRSCGFCCRCGGCCHRFIIPCHLLRMRANMVRSTRKSSHQTAAASVAPPLVRRFEIEFLDVRSADLERLELELHLHRFGTESLPAEKLLRTNGIELYNPRWAQRW